MPTPPRLQFCQDAFTILCLSILIPSMICIITISPVIQTDIPYIVPGVTAAATLFAALVKDRIRHGMLRTLEGPLCRLGIEDDGDNDDDHVEAQRSLQCIDTRWRGILGITEMSEKPRVLPVLLAYLPCALLITAIVTTFTPTASQRDIAYEPLIPAAQYQTSATGVLMGVTEVCAGLARNASSPPKNAYAWPLSDGNKFFGSHYGHHCPATLAFPHVPNFNTRDPTEYAYVESGVAVHRTAMGASAELFRGAALQQVSEAHRHRLQSTRQCVPVLASNPVRCEKGGGTLTRGPGNDTLILQSERNDEHNRTVHYWRNFNKDSGMLNYLWGDNREVDTVGRGYLIFSAYNSPLSGDALFGRDLARALDDPDENAGTELGGTYVATCTIDPDDVFQYRRVRLDLQVPASSERNRTGSDDLTSQRTYSRILTGEESCIPSTETISNLHKAAAMTAHYKLAMENFALDGYFSTVNRIAGGGRGPPYAFEDSRNGLEDALGVVSALGVTLMTEPHIVGVVADAVDWKASATVDVRQLGYGNLVILLFVVPPLLALAILCYFFWTSFRVEHQPGGGMTRVEEAPRDTYVGESISLLVDLKAPRTPQHGAKLQWTTKWSSEDDVQPEVEKIESLGQAGTCVPDTSDKTTGEA